jgi:hypothetical protein
VHLSASSIFCGSCDRLPRKQFYMVFEARPSLAEVREHRALPNLKLGTLPAERSLVILGCSQRKKLTSRLLPAIDRYDGPVFRVLRKHAQEAPDKSPPACVLSGRFGLIPGQFPIPRYERLLKEEDWTELRTRVEEQLKRTLDEIQPEQLFVSLGHRYWTLIEEPLLREISPAKLVVAKGGIGGRASQLAHWLRRGESKTEGSTLASARGEAVLLGTKICLTRDEVLSEARRALLTSPAAAHRFETWYVAVGSERVAPKWLVSILFAKPVSQFRTGDARRVLSLLGVDCIHASRY